MVPTAKYVIDTYGKNGENVIFVGHSLGGGLATAASVVHSKTASTFNAAGVNEHTVAGHDLSMATHLVNACGFVVNRLQHYRIMVALLPQLAGCLVRSLMLENRFRSLIKN